MFLKTAAVLCLTTLTACTDSDALEKVSLEQARIEHEGGKALLIDIRERREHLTGVAQGAMLLPMSELAQRQSLIPKNPDQPVLLICNTQNRSKATWDALKKQGYQNVKNLRGGIDAWSLEVDQAVPRY